MFIELKKKIKKNNNYINIGLKGDTYEIATKLDELLSFRQVNLKFRLDKSNELMW